MIYPLSFTLNIFLKIENTTQKLCSNPRPGFTPGFKKRKLNSWALNFNLPDGGLIKEKHISL
jgi:hypothetical protein